MSAFIDWINTCIAKMRYFDVSATKLAVFLFTLFLVKLWPPLAGLDWRWYFGLSFLAAAPVIFRIVDRHWIIALYLAFYAAIYLAVECLTKL